MTDVIKILLVDDEPRNLDALETILEDPSYQLLRALDADQALRLLLDNDVAAIVLDIKMPGVSGFELAEIIKGTKKFRQIPIVFMTAYLMDDQDILAGYGAGAVDYLTKPVKPQILRYKVAVFADLFRKTRALAELNDHLEARVQERTSELEKSEALLRATNQQKDLFLATLAHELRNPLAPLRTGLDLLMRAPTPNERSPRVLSAMNRQLDHMVRLIDDLLDISRISRGMLELKKEAVSLASVIESAVELARPQIDRQQQLVSVAAEPSLTALVDPTRVCQILGNLLHNASKFAPPKAEIRIELASQDGQASIRVVDPGAGIPREQIERVFDMFTKIERSVPNATGGLGIGLALSRQLAELHGGTLTASSAGEGLGATFTLVLPVIASQTTDISNPESSPNRADAGSLKVAVIEDNIDSAEMLSLWLEGMGHSVRVAHTGPDGLALVLEQRPDVVLCDIGLPEMDGVEVCKRVRSDASNQPTMVALTGWGMENDRRRTSEVGFDHHLVKPVSLDKLCEILEAVAATQAALVATGGSKSA